MSLPRLRFTIGQLHKVVAVVAVFLAVLRAHGWPIMPGTGIILVGFAVDRARGGPGIYGAMIAGVIGVPTVILLVYVALLLPVGGRSIDLSNLVLEMFVGGFVGGAVGTALGYSNGLLVRLNGMGIDRPGEKRAAVAPAARSPGDGDRLSHARTRGAVP